MENSFALKRIEEERKVVEMVENIKNKYCSFRTDSSIEIRTLFIVY